MDSNLHIRVGDIISIDGEEEVVTSITRCPWLPGCIREGIKCQGYINENCYNVGGGNGFVYELIGKGNENNDIILKVEE